jgi:hypothetical protein
MTNLFSVSLDFPFLGISYKLNHTAGGLLGIPAVTWHTVLDFQQCSIINKIPHSF